MSRHTPVLLDVCLELLGPKEGDRILDVTLGLGGHSGAFLKMTNGKATLIGIDADEENLAEARKNLSSFEKSIVFIHSNFLHLPDCLPEEQRTFDCIFADLGLSSPHIDDPARGFTFQKDVPLDMRYDRSQGMTASMLLASLDRETLARIFRESGELPRAGTLADEIIERRRSTQPVRTSGNLVEVATKVYGFKGQSFLPQLFQAIRIAVNNEIAALNHLLDLIPVLLAPGGRSAVISYHSLEDRLVKQFFRELTTGKRDLVTGATSEEAEFELLTKRAMRPDEKECRSNPRSRSACLRAIRKKNVYTHPRSLL
jgi:16S rRNA (cytosine1402-N4)-methyltransferase